MTQANLAFGTILLQNSTPIAELTTISGPTMSVDTVDVTSHDSVYNAGGYKEFLPGLLDGGEVTIEGNLLPGDPGQYALLTSLQNRLVDDYTIEFPAAMATSWSFSALVTAFSTDEAYSAKASFKATLKVSGKPVLNYGYSS